MVKIKSSSTKRSSKAGGTSSCGGGIGKIFLTLVVAGITLFLLHGWNTTTPNDWTPLLSQVLNESKQHSTTKNKKKRLSGAQHHLSNPDKKTAAERKTTSEGGVDVSDPALDETVNIRGDSSTATVMGMAVGYGLDVYKRFVGSLRKTGYRGHIILGVSPDVKPEVLDYFKTRNVTPKILQFVKCTYSKSNNEKGDPFSGKQCAHPYPDIKTRWSRFPLQRDWLQECTTCTGPVLIMDVRDSFFQRDPFGPGSPPITGLQVFQEHPSQTTQHWLFKSPVKQCKHGFELQEPMLCSGTTIGTRAAMLKYLEVMYGEMKIWIQRPECRFPMHGDDQSIHNYLYYTGQLPFAHSIPHREGIINTPGVEGSLLFNKWRQQGMDEEGLEQAVSAKRAFPGASKDNWIGTSYNLTDIHGFFTQADGTRSRVVHQADRFGYFFWHMWLPRQTWVSD